MYVLCIVILCNCTLSTLLMITNDNPKYNYYLKFNYKYVIQIALQVLTNDIT